MVKLSVAWPYAARFWPVLDVAGKTGGFSARIRNGIRLTGTGAITLNARYAGKLSIRAFSIAQQQVGYFLLGKPTFTKSFEQRHTAVLTKDQCQSGRKRHHETVSTMIDADGQVQRAQAISIGDISFFYPYVSKESRGLATVTYITASRCAPESARL